jgi:hypothetical protein
MSMCVLIFHHSHDIPLITRTSSSQCPCVHALSLLFLEVDCYVILLECNKTFHVSMYGHTYVVSHDMMVH